MMMMQMERSKSFELHARQMSVKVRKYSFSHPRLIFFFLHFRNNDYDDEYEKIMNMREKGAKVLGYMLARCLGRSHNMTLHTPDYQKNCILGIIIMIMYKRKL